MQRVRLRPRLLTSLPVSRIITRSSLPKPYTLHPTPYTLHPTPYTLHAYRELGRVAQRSSRTGVALIPTFKISSLS